MCIRDSCPAAGQHEAGQEGGDGETAEPVGTGGHEDLFQEHATRGP